MATKIRLQRFGRKARPFYHIVIADGRAPRDGRFIEKIGTYNPLTNPATIELNFEKAINWVTVGAQPTDSVRAILSYKGVMMKHHLLKGVKKGALTPEQAEVKFQAWMEEKEAKIASKNSKIAQDCRDKDKIAFEQEKKVNEARLEKLREKRGAEMKALEEAAKAAAAAAEAAIQEAEGTAVETPETAE